jgi:hypothetical protein
MTIYPIEIEHMVAALSAQHLVSGVTITGIFTLAPDRFIGTLLGIGHGWSQTCLDSARPFWL